MNNSIINYLILFLFTLSLFNCGSAEKDISQTTQRTPSEEEKFLSNLPSYITRVTHFGQRANWSHDGRKILFVERTYGDVYEVTLETGVIRPVTHHYYHEGYVRANYLSNGDILLSGAPNFDSENPGASRHTNAELWVLDKSLDKPPVPLGTKCSEGAAVSRTNMTIAWAVDDRASEELPEQSTKIWMADINYEDGTPKLENKKLLIDSRDHSFRLKGRLETQDFRSPNEKELIFTAYAVDYSSADVMGINLETNEITNYTSSPLYEEPEGIYPSGKFTLVESDRHNGKGPGFIDIYKLTLDESGQMERLTFFNDNPNFKSSNPAVSDDGRYMAFQMAKIGDPAGVGRGLFIYNFEEANVNRTE
ncbi:hypothetical protein NC796_07930 [Aliifodinibius sp. S!AR15-10]|uniref:hypothetical protein n=1 Tax=Aliifodinibius sp. S!AR15-10 TaxID=2950437 RepID=UPI002862C146|nr:hypothetical protein [Aliifodinibius sp. S!AR15-10]MDR8391062.1 hypothetical protein [Aliifodinibius sp. S!AR15-10]